MSGGTVVVTGGTKRLGRVIADCCRRNGWRVLTSSHRPEAGADIWVDLAQPAGPRQLLAAVRERQGGKLPDAIVNNAALFVGEARTLEQVNFRAPRELAMLMAEETDAVRTIVNILDSRVLYPALDEEGAYEKSKRALLAFTREAGSRFSGRLRVNAVAPGPVLAPTDVHDKAEATPLGRPTPQAVAEAVVWLLSARYTTGCVLPVDGGALRRQAESDKLFGNEEEK